MWCYDNSNIFDNIISIKYIFIWVYSFVQNKNVKTDIKLQKIIKITIKVMSKKQFC